MTIFNQIYNVMHVNIMICSTPSDYLLMNYEFLMTIKTIVNLHLLSTTFDEKTTVVSNLAHNVV